MKAMPLTSQCAFDSPAVYRIGVQGCIPARWCECLDGMAITEHAPEAGPSKTILVGELADQAALAGVLNTLYELHLPVLLVERLSEAAPSSGMPQHLQDGTLVTT